MKKVLAFVLAAALMASMCGGALAATLGALTPRANDARLQAYAGVLSEYMGYELVTAPDGHDVWKDYTYGTVNAVHALLLFDMDNDGGDELLLVGTSADEDGAFWKLWTYSGGAAVCVYSSGGGLIGDRGDDELSLAFLSDGTVGLYETEYVFGYLEEYYDYSLTTLSGASTVSVSDSVGYSLEEDGDWEDVVPEDRAKVDAYEQKKKEALSGVSEEKLLFDGNSYNGQITEYAGAQTLIALAKLRGESLRDTALAQMGYYGESCRMTADDARLFVEKLEEETARIKREAPRPSYMIDEKIKVYAAMAEVENGVPMLLIIGGYVSEWGDTRYVQDTDFGNISAWQAVGGVLVEKPNVSVSPGCCYITMHNYYGTDCNNYWTGVWAVDNGTISDKMLTCAGWREAPEYEENPGVRTYFIDKAETTKEAYDAWFERYEPKNAPYCWIGGGDPVGATFGGYHSAEKVLAGLRLYAEANEAPSYSFPTVDKLSDLFKKLLDIIGDNDVEEIYDLGSGLYYVLIRTDDGYRGTTVRETRRDGEPVFTRDDAITEPQSESDLSQLAAEKLATANVELDFGKISECDTVDELVDYLRECLGNVDGPAPNAPAVGELTTFIESVAADMAVKKVKGKGSLLTVVAGDVSKAADAAEETLTRLIKLLREYGTEPARTLEPVARLIWSVDAERGCQADLDRGVLKALGDCALQICFGRGARVQIKRDGLAALIDALGGISVQLSKNDNGVWLISFLDGNGEVVDTLPSPVTVWLPASGPLSTVFVSYSGGSDNWGGQYDASIDSISFETRYSGEYEVLENALQLDDVAGLTDEERAAVSFMVSKGYLTAENGVFRPDDPLTRYEFTRALVGMFFALDRELTSSFEDVPADSEWYPFVASAQSIGVIEGVGGNKFGGDIPITVEQTLAIASRTLISKKGYTEPDDAEVYLRTFTDGADVSGWARTQTAMAVRDGLQRAGGELFPTSNMTRAHAACVLYELFLRLHEVPPVALELDVPDDENENEDEDEDDEDGALSPAVIAAIVGGGVALVGAGAAVTVAVASKKKRSK